jgi:hypothetical protein
MTAIQAGLDMYGEPVANNNTRQGLREEISNGKHRKEKGYQGI